MSRLVTRILISVILVVIGLVVSMLSVQSVSFQRSYTVARIWRASQQCSTFDAWVDCIKRQAYLTFIDHGHDPSPIEPHFILGNHISTHMGIGTFPTMAASQKSSSNIVCYKSYSGMSLFFCSTIHRILADEIIIDHGSSPKEKERSMVEGIQRAFASGKNVVMLIDAHRREGPMRSLNRVVLEQFPLYQKQLIHLLEPRGTNQFGYRRYPATYDLDVIHQQRSEILRIDDCVY